MRISSFVFLLAGIVERSRSAVLLHKRRRMEESLTTVVPASDSDMPETTTIPQDSTTTSNPTSNADYAVLAPELLNNIELSNQAFTEYIQALHPSVTVPHFGELDALRARLNLRLSVPYWFIEQLEQYVDHRGLNKPIMDEAVSRLVEELNIRSSNIPDIYKVASHWVLMCILPMRLHAKGLVTVQPCVRLADNMVLSSPYKIEIRKLVIEEAAPVAPFIPIDTAKMSFSEVVAAVAFNSLHETVEKGAIKALAAVGGTGSVGAASAVRNTVFTVRTLVSIPFQSFLNVVDALGTVRAIDVPAEIPEDLRPGWIHKMGMWKMFHAKALLKFYNDPVAYTRPLRLDVQTGCVSMRPQYAGDVVRRFHELGAPGI